MSKALPRKTLAGIVALSISATLAACSPAHNSQNSAAPVSQQALQQDVDKQLETFFEQAFDQDLKHSPMFQSRLGYKWDYDDWDNLSESFVEERIELLRQRKNELEAIDPAFLNTQQALSRELYLLDIDRRLSNDEFRHHTYIVNQFRGWHTSIPSFLINTHRVTSVDDAEDYVSRLNGVDELFKQVVAQLRLREQAGAFPPKWSYEQMIKASQNVITGAPFQKNTPDSALWADINNKVDALDTSSAQKAALLAGARQALIESVQPAYEMLIAEMQKQQQMTPEGDGVWRLPDGDAWYQNRLAWYTTTNLNAEQIHQLGLQEVERIHGLMRDIMQKVEFNGTLQEFFEFMRTDDQFYYPNTDEGREAYLRDAKAYIDKMAERIPEYFGLIPQADMIVKRVEPFRERSAGKAFYQSPAKDGSRPGIYYANLYNMRDMPTYQMEALAYHEGIPGHHMQRAISQELEGVPEFQKYVSFTAYTEGWGLYTEELPKDMGFYADPYSDFGRLAMELWRACRLVVDTGIHAKQWSREQAIQYLIDNTPNPQNDAVKAIERYIVLPGQATAYTVGKLKIMELRAFAKQELGEQFDYRGFHDTILKFGPVPLTILERNINHWIESQKNQA